MKRFIVSVLCVAVFFVGLGTLVEKVGAKFKSDEKALSLIRAARQAIGGDSAIAGVQSLYITGKSTRAFKIDGAERIEQGETEIALQLPNKLVRMVKFGKHEGGDALTGEGIRRKVDVVVIRGDKVASESGTAIGTDTGEAVKKIIVKKPDGSTEEINNDENHRIVVRKGDGDLPMKIENSDGRQIIVNKEVAEAHHAEMRQNELLRLTLGLLASAPEGTDVNYTFGGETDVDGTPCNLVVADTGGSSVKLYLNRSSNLPVMIAYTGMRMPMMVRFNAKVPAAADGEKDNVIFTRKVEGPAGEPTEFQVRFSDYRSVGGVQLPYRWVTTVGGAADETLEVSTYEVNPANIADRFADQKVFVRTRKPDGQ